MSIISGLGGIDDIIVKCANKILTVLKLGASALAARVMAGLGLTWVNFVYALPEIKSWLAEKTTGIPDFALKMMGAAGIDIFMTIIVSAIVAKFGFRVFVASVTALESYMQGAGQ